MSKKTDDGGAAAAAAGGGRQHGVPSERASERAKAAAAEEVEVEVGVKEERALLSTTSEAIVAVANFWTNALGIFARCDRLCDAGLGAARAREERAVVNCMIRNWGKKERKR